MLMEQVRTHNAQRQLSRHLELTVGTGLNPGITRQHRPNEDSLFAFQGTQTCGDQLQPFGVFVIADGMGGHTHGQEASNLALRVLSSSVVPPLFGNAALGQDALLELLVNSVRRANGAVFWNNEQDRTNMGTTVTTALVVGATAYVANVGDSRAYLYREPDGLRQLTHDHSVVARLVEAGIITLQTSTRIPSATSWFASWVRKRPWRSMYSQWPYKPVTNCCSVRMACGK